MGRFIIKLVRLILKSGRFGLVCVVIQLNGNSKYIEYMNNEFKEEKQCLGEGRTINIAGYACYIEYVVRMSYNLRRSLLWI